MTPLRTAEWFTAKDVHGFLIRASIKSLGLNQDSFMGRPVIGICNSWSELNHCNAHLRQVADAVKRGVWQAGGVPLEFPCMSLGELFMKPTTMLYRNLLAMEVEESIRANPMDGVVLLCGCDKTTPGMLMGAVSVDIPTIVVTGGPQLKGNWRGEWLGSCTDCRRYFAELRAGRITEEEYGEIENAIIRSPGHCMVMGTASTMACLVETLGMTPPGGGATPAPDSRRYRLAEEAGRQIIKLVEQNVRPSQIMTRKAFENAARVLMALGGSTNAVVHLIAMAGRLGFRLPLSLFDRLSRSTPLLVNLKPSGEYLMEDFFYAGGVPALLKELAPLLDMNTLTVTGKSLGDNVRDALNHDHRVIYPLGTPWKPEGGLAVLKGSLAPNGAIIKQTAASPNLLRHRGKAVVFEGYEELEHRIDDPNLDVSEEDVIVLKNIGPKGGPGMPEWGFLPIPKKLLQKGVRDMVRISDGRMSGTAFGTIVVHVSPEACIGGPLAVVRNGDPIELDASNRLLNLAIPEGELKQRLARWKPPKPRYHRGYGWLYLQHILQAEDGCDFDFLRKRNGARTPAQTRVNNRSQK